MVQAQTSLTNNMADRTLTISHAGGGNETYTINTDPFVGVREMLVDAEEVTVDHRPPLTIRQLLLDGAIITIDTSRGNAIRVLTIDGKVIYIDRSDEYDIQDPVSTFTYVSPTGTEYFQLDNTSSYLRPVKWLLETGSWVDDEVWHDAESWID